MIIELLVNKWFFSFCIGWLSFLLLVDWEQLHKNVWGGICACALQVFQDVNGTIVNLYHINDPGIPLSKTSVLLTFGIIFTMGVLFVQFLPRNPKLQCVHILFFALGFIAFEHILVSYKLLVHENWNYAASFFDNVLVIGSLAWVKTFIN